MQLQNEISTDATDVAALKTALKKTIERGIDAIKNAIKDDEIK